MLKIETALQYFGDEKDNYKQLFKLYIQQLKKKRNLTVSILDFK